MAVLIMNLTWLASLVSALHLESIVHGGRFKAFTLARRVKTIVWEPLCVVHAARKIRL